MKKTILIALSAVLLLAGYSFAGGLTEYTIDKDNPITCSVMTTGADVNVSPSPGVKMAYEVNANGSGYNIGAGNERGTKAYGNSSDFEGMMVTADDYPNDTAFPGIPTKGTTWAGGTWIILGNPTATLPPS